MSESYIEVELSQQPIELYKLLKIADLVSGGGEAKVVISEGYVLLNGEVEYRKRKKIFHEDIIEFNGEVIQLVITGVDATETSVVEHALAENKPPMSQGNKLKTVNEQSSAKAVDTSREIQPKKRRPIAFK